MTLALRTQAMPSRDPLELTVPSYLYYTTPNVQRLFQGDVYMLAEGARVDVFAFTL